MVAQNIVAELEKIRLASPKGMLDPEEVVAYAKANPKSPLHDRFEWRDTVAALAYRIVQAEALIRAVTFKEPVDNRPVRAYFSLPADRRKIGGSYRSIDDVLQKASLRAQLLQLALQDAKSWAQKYATLKELTPAVRAIDRLLGKFKKK